MEDINAKEKKLIIDKIVGALLFTVFGAMGFFYSLWKQNWNSAAWCLLLEVACTFLLVFNKYYLRNELHLSYRSSFFRILKYTAVVLTVCAWCAFTAYIVVGVVQKEAFDVQSHYAASPVALIAGIWYLVLFFDARKYEVLLE